MTAEALPRAASPTTTVADSSAQLPILDIVVPVYNEEADVADSVRRLADHLRASVPYSARILSLIHISEPTRPY